MSRAGMVTFRVESTTYTILSENEGKVLALIAKAAKPYRRRKLSEVSSRFFPSHSKERTAAAYIDDFYRSNRLVPGGIANMEYLASHPAVSNDGSDE